MSQTSLRLDEIDLEEMSPAREIQGLYYIAHFDNLPSILERGILSHNQAERLGIPRRAIDNSQVNQRRSQRVVPDSGGKTLWDFANLYFQPRNAMLYQTLHDRALGRNLAILALKKTLLNREDIYIAPGNAASLNSPILPAAAGRNALRAIARQIDRDWWDHADGSKRTMMAECLVPESVSPREIEAIYVPSEAKRAELSALLANSGVQVSGLPIVAEPERFFQPSWKKALVGGRGGLYLVRGDMFFSRLQTLTISVNCVGVMGKGLASTARNRFPDVYVRYQDLCRRKILRLGRPYLLKRESSVFDDLAHDPSAIENPDEESQTWFLLFPTKDHWRNRSTLDSIDRGMAWLLAAYEREGIQSLALPALGCGLGGLPWERVGPLMCRYLAQMQIDTTIYLPAERAIADEFLTREFLLGPAD